MLRKIRSDEVDGIRLWRNHPSVREVSLTTHVISEAEHRAWWLEVAADHRRDLLIYEFAGHACGVVDLRPLAEDAVLWSFYFDIEGLEARGQLLSAWLSLDKDVIEYVTENFGHVRLVGEVRASNVAVLRLHRRSGFAETDRRTQLIDGAQVEIMTIERQL